MNEEKISMLERYGDDLTKKEYMNPFKGFKDSHSTGLERSKSQPPYAGWLIFQPYRLSENHAF